LFIAADVDGKSGSVAFEAARAAAAELETATGASLQSFPDLLAARQLWVPATFPACPQREAHHTFDATDGAKRRADFAAVGCQARLRSCEAFVTPGMDAILWGCTAALLFGLRLLP
jgi:hypothetical protein